MTEDDIICNQLISDDINCARNTKTKSKTKTESYSKSNKNMCSEPPGSEQILEDDQPKPARNKQREANELFERLWDRYPNNRGKGSVSDAKKRALLDVGEDQMIRAIQRYVEEHNAKERSGAFTPNWKNGSTFFNSGYLDYLDANYAPAPVDAQARQGHRSAFVNYEQSGTDWDAVADQVMQVQYREGG
jgi:hypothetical protein